MTRHDRRFVGTRPVPQLERLLGPPMPGAACRGQAPNFDGEIDGETAAQRRVRLAYAARVCDRCPVRERCRLIADELPRGLRSGVWSARPYC